MPRTLILCLIGVLYSGYLPVVAQGNAAQGNPAQGDAAQANAAPGDAAQGNVAPDEATQEPSPKGDAQTNALVKQIQDLKQLVADENKKIAELEKSIRAIQAFLMPAPKPIPDLTPAWTLPSNWSLIKAGMSEAQVVQILGMPSRVQSVTDSRVLYYQPDIHSASTLSGSVTLMDDRVIAMSPPAF